MTTRHRAEHSQQRTSNERWTGLWIHMTIYVLVNAGLIMLDLMRSPDKIWFHWPLGGWGIGLAFHAWAVYNHRDRIRDSDREASPLQ